MAAASRPLATALGGGRFASGLPQPNYSTKRDTTRASSATRLRVKHSTRSDSEKPEMEFPTITHWADP